MSQVVILRSRISGVIQMGLQNQIHKNRNLFDTGIIVGVVGTLVSIIVGLIGGWLAYGW